jgi:hypothetical protein
MPGYGTLGPEEGTGLLPWSWTVERLAGSRNYWLATVRPDGRPHVRVRPRWAFGLDSTDFTGSPTRWVFEEDA